MLQEQSEGALHTLDNTHTRNGKPGAWSATLTATRKLAAQNFCVQVLDNIHEEASMVWESGKGGCKEMGVYAGAISFSCWLSGSLRFFAPHTLTPNATNIHPAQRPVIHKCATSTATSAAARLTHRLRMKRMLTRFVPLVLPSSLFLPSSPHPRIPFCPPPSSSGNR